ncbi:recombinase family protein [Streptomyces katrae]|uniref:Recombinase family protein n=1 Tax=Streptomyces katrae TaxID=68223 RepID=A0ABT7GS66_9ACTN|nr:recombinase family protein [Streptomyces katrae]MDK9496156.1 recombinase family protein [Streptomyces katrae]
MDRVEAPVLVEPDRPVLGGMKMMVSVLAAVLEFQRDMISENTREGVAAAAAAGKTLGAPPRSTRARRSSWWRRTAMVPR